VQQLDDFVTGSVEQACGLREFERGLLDRLREVGRELTDRSRHGSFAQVLPDLDEPATGTQLR